MFMRARFAGHQTALRAIRRCRTPDSGELHVRCTACDQAEWRPLSCGHRSCPKCQNHEASKWLDRQQTKLLPVPYFMVTFSYIDSDTGGKCYRTLKREDFLWLVLQHVLPRGFRRVRDYGFLHGNAKRLLLLVQLILRVMLEPIPPRSRPVFKCPRCKAVMEITAFRRPAWLSG